jgi:protein TonB
MAATEPTPASHEAGNRWRALTRHPAARPAGVFALALALGVLLGLLRFGLPETNRPPPPPPDPAPAAGTTPTLPTPPGPAPDLAIPEAPPAGMRPPPYVDPRIVDQAPASTPGDTVVVSERQARPLPNQPAPGYPSQALRRRIEGEVLLRVEVDARGRPTRVQVERGSGARQLDAAAVAAVRRWRFEPALHDGQPVPSSVLIPIAFRLER